MRPLRRDGKGHYETVEIAARLLLHGITEVYFRGWYHCGDRDGALVSYEIEPLSARHVVDPSDLFLPLVTPARLAVSA